MSYIESVGNISFKSHKATDNIPLNVQKATGNTLFKAQDSIAAHPLKTPNPSRRIPLKDRILPTYTLSEERLNYISHIVGTVFGIVVLVLCVVRAALHGNTWGIVSGAVYGVSMILLYTMSSIYHGLPSGMAKKVMQVLDHCTIYLLICGTYTPVLLSGVRTVSPAWAWSLFGVVWGLGIVAIVLTAIDLKKYQVFSMICYIGMGWCIIAAAGPAVRAITRAGFMWLLAGGVAYSIGAVLYGIGKKKRYMHSLFHFFVLAGSILQCVCIFRYVM